MVVEATAPRRKNILRHILFIFYMENTNEKTVLKENNSCRMQCIAEENLEQEMDSQVEPFLKQVQICGWMEVAPEGGESQERDGHRQTDIAKA